MFPFCPLLKLLFAFNFPVNAAESDKSEVWWKNLRQWSSWNHTLTSSDFWDMLWNRYAQLGCMGLIELCDIKRMRLILLQIFFYFGSFFLGLKVSRKWLDYLLHTLGALRRVTSGIYGICFIWMSQPCFVSAFRSIIHRDLAVREKKHAKWQTLEWLETSSKRISMKDR